MAVLPTAALDAYVVEYRAAKLIWDCRKSKKSARNR
jgi:hypothetical protein